MTRYNSGHLSKLNKSASGSKGKGAGFGATGCRDVDDNRAEGSKMRWRKDKKVSLTHP
jgi:hypothetical protein